MRSTRELGAARRVLTDPGTGMLVAFLGAIATQFYGSTSSLWLATGV